jgi:cyanoexosortase B-associated protein
MLLSLPKPLSRAKLLLIGLLLILVLLGTFQGYTSGQWRWKQPPEVATIKALRQVRQAGITIGGAQKAPQMVTIGEHKWLQQEIPIPGQSKSALLLMLPQNSQTQQPQVEWMDIDGAQRWRSDAVETLNFTVPSAAANPTAAVSARWFRAWTRSQTYAVLQWYAQPTGGSPSPSAWFVADRLAQWQNRRVPWVAVSLLLPIGPVEELPQARPTAASLAVAVQTALMQDALKP